VFRSPPFEMVGLAGRVASPVSARPLIISVRFWSVKSNPTPPAKSRVAVCGGRAGLSLKGPAAGAKKAAHVEGGSPAQLATGE
jgi:hypothetical protein